MPRRFPPPWSIEEGAACFIVRDHDKLALAYVYYEKESGRRSPSKPLTRDEARRIAANGAKPHHERDSEAATFRPPGRLRRKLLTDSLSFQISEQVVCIRVGSSYHQMARANAADTAVSHRTAMPGGLGSGLN